MKSVCLCIDSMKTYVMTQNGVYTFTFTQHLRLKTNKNNKINQFTNRYLIYFPVKLYFAQTNLHLRRQKLYESKSLNKSKVQLGLLVLSSVYRNRFKGSRANICNGKIVN